MQQYRVTINGEHHSIHLSEQLAEREIVGRETTGDVCRFGGKEEGENPGIVYHTSGLNCQSPKST